MAGWRRPDAESGQEILGGEGMRHNEHPGGGAERTPSGRPALDRMSPMRSAPIGVTSERTVREEGQHWREVENGGAELGNGGGREGKGVPLGFRTKGQPAAIAGATL
jgi:hypothetical protein